MIIDNIVPVSLQQKLEHIISSVAFDWYFQEDQTFYTKNNTNSGYQFCHTFMTSERPEIVSRHIDLISTIVYMFEDKTGISVKEIIRAKANLLVNNSLTEHQVENNIHTDSLFPDVTSPLTHMSMVYYVNDSDGDTVIWDKGAENEPTRVSPKRGRLAYFPSNTLHRPSQPVLNDRRMVINFVIGI